MLRSRLGFIIYTCQVQRGQVVDVCFFKHIHKALNFRHIGGKNDGGRNWKVLQLL